MRWISSIVFFSLLFYFSTSSARADFCEARGKDSIVKTIEKISVDSSMRLSFKNEGGLLNGGVCWWHSRFQRAAWYLADFDPSAPKPSPSEAKTLIRNLISRNRVVRIPGYRNLADFSSEYKQEIQSALNHWQLRDSFINQAYFRGLSGHSHFLHPEDMRRRMDQVYERYVVAKKVGDVLWLLLQMRGIYSHASLLRTMSPTPEGGYRLDMVDSNFPQRLVKYIYRPGDLELNPSTIELREYTSVPYAGFQRDLNGIHRAIAQYCGKPPILDETLADAAL